jgi:hypothetical protein
MCMCARVCTCTQLSYCWLSEHCALAPSALYCHLPLLTLHLVLWPTRHSTRFLRSLSVCSCVWGGTAGAVCLIVYAPPHSAPCPCICASPMQVLMPDGQPVQIRIGIHTGPCVSGLVGTGILKWSVFGDTGEWYSTLPITDQGLYKWLYAT